jgi:ABC-type dipeptide/oligopeptide/nickel transport system permease component
MLFWAPRLLCIAFAVFVSLFALDVFEEGYGLWRTLAALAMHLIPTAIILAVLALAWRWEWIGAVVFTGLALLYVRFAQARGHLEWTLVISLPLLLLAALFLVNWVKRAELRN